MDCAWATPFAGMNRIRFDGCDLSAGTDVCTGTPVAQKASAKLSRWHPALWRELLLRHSLAWALTPPCLESRSFVVMMDAVDGA